MNRKAFLMFSQMRTYALSSKTLTCVRPIRMVRVHTVKSSGSRDAWTSLCPLCWGGSTPAEVRIRSGPTVQPQSFRTRTLRCRRVFPISFRSLSSSFRSFSSFSERTACSNGREGGSRHTANQRKNRRQVRTLGREIRGLLFIWQKITHLLNRDRPGSNPKPPMLTSRIGRTDQAGEIHIYVCVDIYIYIYIHI